MRDICFGFTCTCGIPDLEADIVVDYAGSSGSYWEPPEGAEWHLAKPVVCEDFIEKQNGVEVTVKGCGKVWDNNDVAEKFDEEIQKRIAERDHDDY